MNKFLKSSKDDSGMILGIVLISLTIVGTVLGSVLMMSQISMESKGQSLEKLKSKNVQAQAAAVNLKDLAIVEEVANNSGNSVNCGVPTEYEGSKITCTLENSSNANTTRVLLDFTDLQGNKHSRIFSVPNNSKSASGSESD